MPRRRAVLSWRHCRPGGRQVTERLSPFVIAWLEKHGPLEWHGVATAWNWDNGVGRLLWILEQPDCDLSTGLEIFWLGESYSELDANDSGRGADRECASVARKA